MDAEKVQAWAREADEYADRKHLIGGVRLRREFRAKWNQTRDAHFARLARATAFEEAAKVCEQQSSEPECPERAQYCADAIRALAAAEKGPR